MRKITILSICFLWLNAVGATDFYVKNGGDDSAAGTSDATAWASLSKINELELKAGDREF